MTLKVDSQLSGFFSQIKETPIKWTIVCLALLVLAARQLIPNCKSLIGRCSLEHDIVAPLKKKIQNSESMMNFKDNFIKNGVGTLSLNSSMLEHLLNIRGSLYLKGTLTQMEISHEKGFIKTPLNSAEAEQVSLLISPTSNHIIALFKNAVAKMSSDAIKANRSSYLEKNNPELKPLVIPGGGGSLILKAKTEDGRAWGLYQDTYSGIILEQLTQQGSCATEACKSFENTYVKISDKDWGEIGLFMSK